VTLQAVEYQILLISRINTGVLNVAADKHIEEGLEFLPKFDSNGLITAISQDAYSGQILMVAYMNDEALRLTLATGNAVFFSRSRKKLWKKGEQSGHVQKVQQILVDCDQDCLILKVTVDEGQCHVGYQSCFYRAVTPGTTQDLECIAEKVYDPNEAYKK
jgi:phosphoribosyl-AMP cyclohydrolase